jgi:hypothetical protein
MSKLLGSLIGGASGLYLATLLYNAVAGKQERSNARAGFPNGNTADSGSGTTVQTVAEIPIDRGPLSWVQGVEPNYPTFAPEELYTNLQNSGDDQVYQLYYLTLQNDSSIRSWSQFVNEVFNMSNGQVDYSGMAAPPMADGSWGL